MRPISFRFVLAAVLLFASVPAANAQFAVVDVGAIAQLLQQVQTMRDQLVAVVNLYKALGGGWYGSDAPPPELPEPPTNAVLIANPDGVGGQ